MSQIAEKRIVEAREELRRALADLRGEPVVESGMDERPPPPLRPVDPDADSTIMVGLAEGKPGDLVKVEILARTTFEASGISLAIGVNPLVALVGTEETDEVRDALGINDPEDITKQHRGTNWQNQFVQTWILFYRQLFGTPDADQAVEDAEAGKKTNFNRQIVPTAFPSLIPVYRLIFKIPTDAKPGTQIPLDVEQKYGRYYKTTPSHSIFVESPNFFTGVRGEDGWKPSRRPAQLISGWIDVVTDPTPRNTERPGPVDPE